MLRRVALVRTDLSEELSASIIRVTRIGELGTLAVTSNRRTLRRNTKFPKCRFLQEPHGVISQKTPFFIVTAVKTSNLTCINVVSPATTGRGIMKIEFSLPDLFRGGVATTSSPVVV
jgi:hypothetical protein